MGGTMVSLSKQFTGQARLIRLLLWKIGDSTDIDACLETAREANMLSDDDEAFLRECLEREERQRVADAEVADATAIDSANPADVDSADAAIDKGTIERLRRCADKLNRADSA